MSDYWLCAYSPSESFDRLMEFLTERGRFIRTENYETHELTPDGKLCIEKYDGYSKVLMKHGSSLSVHDETEIRCRESDFENLLSLFSSLGYFPLTVWKINRHLFDWEQCMVYVDKIDDFGIVVRLKLYAQLKRKEDAVAEAEKMFGKLGLQIVDKEDFDQKIMTYRSNKSEH